MNKEFCYAKYYLQSVCHEQVAVYMHTKYLKSDQHRE